MLQKQTNSLIGKEADLSLPEVGGGGGEIGGRWSKGATFQL